jgi:hypothetical protein
MSVPDRRSSMCPGCGIPIVFEALELMAPDAPANREVMCAFCGTVTSRLYLRRHAYGASSVTRRTTLRARAATRAATAPIAALSPFTQPDPSNGDQP